MKKLLIILIALYFNLFADEIILGSVKVLHYVEILKTTTERELQFRYDTDDKTISMLTVDTFGIAFVTMQKKEQVLFLSNFNKFLEWDKQATEKKIKLSKKISSIPLKMFWQYGDDWHKSYYKEKILFAFVSLQVGRNYLCINFPKYTSSKNSYVEIKIGMYSINAENVKKIIKLISKENINKKIAEKEKQKNISSDFK